MVDSILVWFRRDLRDFDHAALGEAQRRALTLQPDVILLDNHLPGVNGVDALPALREAAPAARLIILTISENEADLAGALRAGACGYLLKTMEGEALTRAIHRVMQGENVVADAMTGKLVSAYRQASTTPAAAPAGEPPTNHGGTLSPREFDILRGIARGDRNKLIARDLGIAETTVKIHVQHILRKLDVSSRVQVAVIAIERGLI